MPLRCENCRKTRSACAFRCRLCGDLVGATHLRDHQEGHNPNAAGMDFEYIVAQFIPETEGTDGHLAPPAAVVIGVRGGVAEVLSCPAGVRVEIRDYDTEGCEAQRLAPDGAVVSLVDDPVQDDVGTHRRRPSGRQEG